MNSVRRDKTDSAGPTILCGESAPNKICNSGGGGGVYTEENDAAGLHRDRSLKSKLPEIPIKREQNSPFGFGAFEYQTVWRAGVVRPDPQDVMLNGAKVLDSQFREILIRKQSHAGDYADSGKVRNSWARWLAYERQASRSSCVKPG